MQLYRSALVWVLRVTGVVVFLVGAPTFFAALAGSWSPYDGADIAGFALSLMNLWVGPLLLLGLAEAVAPLLARKPQG
jgi:hypothetical protein